MALEGLDLRGTHADLLHRPADVARNDPVPNLERPLGKQDQAGDEVGDDILQAETETEGKTTGDERKVRQVDARR